MTTMHPARDVLLAHADGELSDLEERDIARHVETCMDCDRVVAGLQAGSTVFSDALQVVDSVEPAHWAGPSTDSAVRDDADALSLRPSARFPSSGELRRSPARITSSGPLRWAAGILLLAGATVSAAIVGSYMLSETRDATATVAEPARDAAAVAAVMVTPLGGEIRVAVSGAGADSRLFVTFADRADASVAVEGAVSPRFRVEDGRVDLELEGAAAVVRLTLPASLRTATVTTNETVIATVRDGQVQPAAAMAGVPLGPDIEPGRPRIE